MNWKLSQKFLFDCACLLLLLAWGMAELVLAQDRVMANGPEDLEREVRLLVNEKVEELGDVDGILNLASLYLDLGYGFYSDPSQKIPAFKEGARLAKKGLVLREDSVLAHFLYAANLGSAAELEGMVASVFIVQELKRHVQRVLELDGTYAPAHHMLGRMYEELPWFLGGDQSAAREHLSQAVKLNPLYAPARLDWARWLLKQGQREEARRELRIVRDQPPLDKKWLWDRKYRPEAMALLHRIASEEGSAQ
ncbi:MAG: TRAP transporter TatT component family protein [Nitrospirales bacterium]|nr:TRAP transporter TatT component family protein [Nitrospirales bacterium]